MKLPKYQKSIHKGEIGLTITKKTIEKDLGWMFRRNHQEHDFGIDAFIDIINNFGEITGKTIALQIKTGNSYFSKENELGWEYRGHLSHLNYYLNHDIPVLIFLVNDETEEIFWAHCNPEKTTRTGDSWKITIPKKQKLTQNSKLDIKEFISPEVDYVSQLEHYWKINDFLKTREKILLIVAKEEIIHKKFENLLLMFDRFENSGEDLIIHFREKVDILIDGYNEDNRELNEIPEVMDWVR